MENHLKSETARYEHQARLSQEAGEQDRPALENSQHEKFRSAPQVQNPQSVLDEVTVYGFTNRTAAADGKSFLPLMEVEGLDKKTSYYKQTIRFETDSKSALVAETAGDITILSSEQYMEELARAKENTDGKLGIYIPGIRNAPGVAAFNAGQMARSMHSTMVVADWASSSPNENESLLAMVSQTMDDTSAAIKSQPFIDRGIVNILSRLGSQDVDLIAHSRGASLLCNSLSVLQHLGMPPVKAATFLHGDKSTEKYLEMFPHMYRAASRVNFVVDKDDLALKLSSSARFMVTPIVDKDWRLFPSTANIGSVGLPDSLKQRTRNYVPANYFRVFEDRGFGLLRHTPGLSSTVSAMR